MSAEKETQAHPPKSEKEQLEIHKDQLRNGPAQLRYFTNGQLERIRVRVNLSKAKKDRRAQLKAYHTLRREGMTIRGHLQAVGLINFSKSSYSVPDATVRRSAGWLVQNFEGSYSQKDGKLIVSEGEMLASFERALNRWQEIVGLPVESISSNYKLPAALA